MTIGFRLKWKCIRGQFPSAHNRKEGETIVYDVTADAAVEGFLRTSNMFGRKFKVLSVTEIDNPKPKKAINAEHKDYDKQPKFDDVPV